MEENEHCILKFLWGKVYHHPRELLAVTVHAPFVQPAKLLKVNNFDFCKNVSLKRMLSSTVPAGLASYKGCAIENERSWNVTLFVRLASFRNSCLHPNEFKYALHSNHRNALPPPDPCKHISAILPQALLTDPTATTSCFLPSVFLQVFIGLANL